MSNKRMNARVAREKFKADSPNGPVLSSAEAAWNGIAVEQHHLPAGESPEVWNPEYVVCVQLSPPLTLEWMTNGRFKSKCFVPGNSCVLPVGNISTARWNDDVDLLRLAINPALFARVAHESLYPERIELVMQRAVDDPQIRYIALAFKAELETGCLGGRLYGETLATALSIHLLRHYSAVEPVIREFTGGLAPHKLRQVVDYINAHLAANLSLDELAAVVEMSSYHFARAFKQSTHLTPFEYVIERRITRAQELLTTTKLPIIDICMEVGFQNQSHFTKLFRRLTRTTPKAYREATVW